MPQFDWAGARAAGYSDSEIADFISGAQGFDAPSARKAGYSDADIIGYLNKRSGLQDQMAQLKEEGRAAQTRLETLEAYESDKEIPFLGRTEFGRQLGSGIARMAGGTLQFASALTPESPAELARLGSVFGPGVVGGLAGLASSAIPGGLSNRLREAGSEVSGLADIPTTAPKSISEIETAGDIPGFLGAQVIQQIPQILATAPIAGALRLLGAGKTLTGAAAPIITTAPQEGGAIYGEIVEATGETGPLQRAAGIGGGLLSGALETIGAVPAGTARRIAQGAVRESVPPVLGIAGAAQREARDIAQELAQQYAQRGVGGFARGVGKDILSEGLTEAGQEGVSILSVGAGGGGLPTAQEAATRVIGAGLTGGFIGGAIGGTQSGIGRLADARREARLEQELQDYFGRLGARSVDRGDVGAVYGAPLQAPSAETGTPISTVGGIAQTYLGEGRSVGPSGTRLSNAERRRLELEGMYQEAPAPAAEVAAEPQIGQYPPEGFGTGVIPSQQEIERRAAVRRVVAERNRAEAEARRAEAAGRIVANPQEEARIMAQLEEEEAAARVRMAEEEARIMAQLQAEQASVPLGRLEAAQASRYGAATRPIAEEPRETLGMSPEVAQRLRDLRAQEQLQLQKINEAAVQVPEARQPAVKEGGQGAQGPSRVDRQAEVREGQVPADVTGRSEVAAAQPKVEPPAAAAAKLTYGDGSELATGDVTSLDKSVFGEDAAKVLGKTIIRGSVSQNPDGSVSVRVSNAGVTTRRTKAARATPTLAQKAGVSLGDVLTFKPLADGGFSVDRVSADGTAFPTVRIKKLKGLFNKQAAPSVQPETVAPSENDQKKSLVMQLIGGALENEKYNEFKRLLERSVFRGETDEGNQELDDFEDSLTDQEKIIFRAAFYREVGVDQMMDRFAKMAPGLSVDSTDLANKWDDALVGFVTRGLKDKAWANSWSPNTAQTSIVIDQIRKAQRSPLSLVEEPRPQGESTLTGQQARKEEIPPSESVDITSTADTRRFNARMFNRLAESIGAMERLNRGRRLNADQLRSAFDKEVAGFNREAFAEAFAGASADVIKTQLDGAFKKVLALYEHGGAARIADEADAYEAGETNVVELLSRAPQAPTGLPSNQVSARLQSQFGIPANALVRVVSEPNVDWDGRSLFRNGVLVGIQINAANVSNEADVDKVMLHELSEAANANGELANEIKLITDQEASKIFIQVRLLGYDPSVFTREEDARKVEQLVNAWRGRNWFERVVGRVMAWASTKGVRLTRLAAEYVAAKAIAKVQAEVSRASTTTSSGGIEVRESKVATKTKDPWLKTGDINPSRLSADLGLIMKASGQRTLGAYEGAAVMSDGGTIGVIEPLDAKESAETAEFAGEVQVKFIPVGPLGAEDAANGYPQNGTWIVSPSTLKVFRPDTSALRASKSEQDRNYADLVDRFYNGDEQAYEALKEELWSAAKNNDFQLKRMFHGTPSGTFSEFWTLLDTRSGLFGEGAYFTDNRDVATEYALNAARSMDKSYRPKVYDLYLKVENPLDMDRQAVPENWAKSQTFKSIAKDITERLSRADSSNVLRIGIDKGTEQFLIAATDSPSSWPFAGSRDISNGNVWQAVSTAARDLSVLKAIALLRDRPPSQAAVRLSNDPNSGLPTSSPHVIDRILHNQAETALSENTVPSADMMEAYNVVEPVMKAEMQSAILSIRKMVTEMGHDGITHIGGGRFNPTDERRHRVIIAFEPSQIKSADLITYDNQGRVIPPRRRFDTEKLDIRESKTTFRNRIQVAEEAGVPGLLPNQQAVIERSAAAQAASVPSSIKARISAASDRSQRSLAWLVNIVDLSDSPDPLSAMNPADPLTPMVASAVVGQIDRTLENRAKLVGQLERIQEEMASPKRAKQLAELATANAAANAAGAAYEALVKDFRNYNRQEILTYSGTDASLKNAITRASDSVRLLSAESAELRKAFEIMAEAVPPSVVSAAKAAKDTQPIVDYVTNNNVLTGKVRQSTIDLLLTPPAAGKKSPLQSYRGLASALTTISDYKADVEIAKADRKKFEDQFAATSPSAKAKSKRVDVEDFAKRYRNLRNAEADASERIRTISREIDLLDSALLSTLEQIEILDEVIKSPEFSEAYQTATNILDLRLPEIVGGLDPKTGDEVFKIGGIEYRLPRRFDVTADQEAAAKVLEIYNAATARLDEIKNGSDPVRPDEVNALIQLQQRMAQYGHSVGDAALSTGPFNPIRLVRSLPFLRALVSRRHLARMIPGRLSSELSLLNSTGDSLEKAIDSVRRDKNVGQLAIDMLQFRAINSHPGLTPMQWKVEVANELLNARQNDRDYMPEAGDTTPFGHVVTKEDIAAIKLMARQAHRYYGLTTGKDRGGIIRFFQPTMISEGNRTRLPYMTGADMTPRRLIRDDSEGSPIYYAKLLVKALENPDMASRMAEIEKILSEPKAFQMMARRYVWETNSDFKNTSPYAKVYKALALQWWKDGKTAPKDLDELIEQIAMRVPAVGASVDIESAVKEALLSEIAAFSKAAIDDAATSMSTATKYVQDGLGEPIEGGEPTSPAAIVSVVDSFNQFTKPRGAMVAPGIFYSYTLSTGEEMNGLAAAAMMPVRIRQLRALIDLKNAVSRYKTNLAERINSDPDSVKADVRSGKLYTDYAETNNLLNTLSAVTEVFKQRVESPNVHNESGLLKAWNAVHKTLLVSALTASVRNILFGIAGGDVAGRMMIRGGGSGSVGSAFLAGGPRVAVRLLERIFTNNPAAMSFIRANKGKLGVLGERLMKSAEMSAAIQNAARLGGWEVDEPSISERAAQVSETGTYGNVIQSRGQLQKSMLSKIERMFTPRLVAKVKESVFRFQPAGDQLANEMNAKDAMQRLALTFMSGYRIMQNRAATGVKGWDNWADPANIIKPAEAKAVAGWSPELLISLKQLVAPAGSLEYVLHDFYKRVEDAKSKGQDIYSVPPIADENALADVLIRVLSASNLPSDSSRADLIKTRSTLGQTLNFFWGFPGWINNWLDTLEGISSVSTERKAQIEKNVLPVLYMFTMLSLMALGGLWPNELMAIFYRIINGRPYPIMTARDFLESPSAKSLTKLMSVSLAGMVPYAGEYIAGYVGATQNKPNLTDLAKMSVPLGVLGNFAQALKTAWSTGDVGGAVLSMTRGTLPILNPVINRLPDVAARDAVNDAVRVASRNAGDLEMKTRGGAGGNEPTEFSSLIKRAVAANASGDSAGAQRLLNRAAEVKAATGVGDPWSAVKASLKSQLPEQKAFGRMLSADEKVGLRSRMSPEQRAVFDNGDRSVQQLVDGIKPKAEREGGGGMTAMRRIRALTRKPKAIRTIRTKLRKLRPMKLRLTRGGRSGSKLRVPKPLQMAALGPASRARRMPAGLMSPLGRGYALGMPAASIGI